MRRRLTSTATVVPSTNLLPTGQATDTDLIVLRIKNPLLGIPRDKLRIKVDRFVDENGLDDIRELCHKGSLVGQKPADFENLTEIDETEKQAFRDEILHKCKRTYHP